ncbi:MAG: hypothetical protein ACREEC_02220 [Thermoplasmata archaeon]
MAAIALPLFAVWISLYVPSSPLNFRSGLAEGAALSVLVGSALLFLALTFYEFGFSAARAQDRRFRVALVLCSIGSVGFVLLVVTAAVLLGLSDSIVACAHGQPTQILSCLDSLSPFGRLSAVIGFWFAWIGAAGIVLGLLLGARDLGSGLVAVGAVLYAVLLASLVGPFVSLVSTVPGVEYLLLVAPVLGLVAPVLVLLGSRR